MTFDLTIRKTNPLLRHSAILIIYSLIFIWFTYPLCNHFSTSYIGYKLNGDAHQYYWNIFNFKSQLLQGKNPFYTTYIFAPKGSSLLMHTYTPILGIFALPFSNPILALNLALALQFVLSAYGAYLLCNRFINNNLLSLVSGLVYAFNPYKMLHLYEHYHLLLSAAVPFFILSFLSAFIFNPGQFIPQLANFKQFVFCLLLGIIMVLGDYYSTFSILYFCFFYAVYNRFFTKITYSNLKFWIYTILILISCHIVLHQFRVHGLSDKGGLWWSGDLLGYVIPSFNSRYLYGNFWRHIEQEIYRYPGSVEYCMFLGYSMLLVFLIFFIWLKKHNLPQELKPIAFIGLVFFFMTIPTVTIGGKALFNLPVAFLHYVPFINNIRSPTRMSPMVALLLVPIGLMALNSLKFRKSITQVFMACLLFVVIIIEYRPVDYPLVKVNEVPIVIKNLNKLPQGNLLYIPFGVRDGFTELGKFETKKLWYQTVHQKPMVDGYISRMGKNNWHLNDSNYLKMDSMQKNSSYKPSYLHIDKSIRFIIVEPSYIKNFEPTLDSTFAKPIKSKEWCEGYLLYVLY